jgi:dsRNA-specific ribonuclease
VEWRARLSGEAAADVAALDAALGVALSDRELVTALLDPRGALFQRLEYVGDSILDAVVVRELVARDDWSRTSLAPLAAGQQALVSDHALGRVAARRRLPPVRTFPASRHRLADRIEAAIGAVWVDAGLARAEQVARRLVVVPALGDPVGDPPEPDGPGDLDAERAVTVLGHGVRRPAWFGAAARPGPAQRRLAVVGNAVLEAACSMAQYVDQPLDDEAALSDQRRGEIANSALAARARELGLVADGSLDSRSVADRVQALVGAATFDAGLASGVSVACGVLGRHLVLGPLR